MEKFVIYGNMLYRERFHSRDQHLYKFNKQKDSVYIRREINSHQHGRHFIVWTPIWPPWRHVKTLYCAVITQSKEALKKFTFSHKKPRFSLIFYWLKMTGWKAKLLLPHTSVIGAYMVLFPLLKGVEGFSLLSGDVMLSLCRSNEIKLSYTNWLIVCVKSLIKYDAINNRKNKLNIYYVNNQFAQLVAHGLSTK